MLRFYTMLTKMIIRKWINTVYIHIYKIIKAVSHKPFVKSDFSLIVMIASLLVCIILLFFVLWFLPGPTIGQNLEGGKKRSRPLVFSYCWILMLLSG